MDLKLSYNITKINIAYLLLPVLLLSCTTQSNNNYRAYFEKNKMEYNQLSNFLKHHQTDFINTSCDKTFKSFKQLNEEGCYPAIKDSLDYFISKNLFEAVDFYKDKSIELLVNIESNKMRDKENTFYFIYTDSNQLPDIYTNYKVKEKLDKHWWYVEKEDAYY